MFRVYSSLLTALAVFSLSLSALLVCDETSAAALSGLASEPIELSSIHIRGLDQHRHPHHHHHHHHPHHKKHGHKRRHHGKKQGKRKNLGEREKDKDNKVYLDILTDLAAVGWASTTTVDVSSAETCTDPPSFEDVGEGEGESTFDIDFECDRSGSSDVALWFAEGLNTSMMLGLDAVDDMSPQELNFAFKGDLAFTLSDGGTNFTCPEVRFGQGHIPLANKNNWWIGCDGGSLESYALICPCDGGLNVYFWQSRLEIDDRFGASTVQP